MPLNVSKKADFTVAEFDGELTIFNVREEYQQLAPLLDKAPDKLIVDLSALQEFDSAGLQLMLWLRQRLADSQLTFSLEDNQAVQQVLTLYRLNPDFSPLVTETEE